MTKMGCSLEDNGRCNNKDNNCSHYTMKGKMFIRIVIAYHGFSSNICQSPLQNKNAVYSNKKANGIKNTLSKTNYIF